MKTEEIIREVPKVLLHDHLDGGLRPETIIELAEEIGYTKLPTKDPRELAEWFFRGANKGNLVEFLQGFEYTIAVMQTKENLERIAYEMIEDMHKDGIVYVETRFAPVLSLDGGLYYDDVMKAVLAGLERGKKEFGVGYGLILCSLRNMTNSLEIAELAVNYRDKGVVGFDLAGEEGGYPPKDHIDAFQFIMRENFNITIHAGEAFGKDSIWQAIQYCGSHRIGHATRLKEDIVYDENGKIIKLGNLAQYILDKRIPLEICLNSNVHTGAIDKIENHPFKELYNSKFRVFLNTDDRLMSNITLTDEYITATEVFGITFDDIEKLNVNAMKSAFISHDKKLEYIYNVIKPGYKKMREKLLSLKV
ncbi:MAG: adenosine deaminase [Melioribacteraceae bacterium]|jgi:adenosine deaminase|nr:adenosine deaminase [Melioribacteraceae bacterium]